MFTKITVTICSIYWKLLLPIFLKYHLPTHPYFYQIYDKHIYINSLYIFIISISPFSSYHILLEKDIFLNLDQNTNTNTKYKFHLNKSKLVISVNLFYILIVNIFCINIMVYYNYKGKSVLQQKKKDVFFYKSSLQYTIHKLANCKVSQVSSLYLNHKWDSYHYKDANNYYVSLL